MSLKGVTKMEKNQPSWPYLSKIWNSVKFGNRIYTQSLDSVKKRIPKKCFRPSIPLNRDHLWRTITFLVSRGWLLYTGLTVLQKVQVAHMMFKPFPLISHIFNWKIPFSVLLIVLSVLYENGKIENIFFWNRFVVEGNL